jgi:hypothetical protein
VRKIMLISFAAALLVLGCATNMTPSEAGNSDAARKVLIAGDSSAFKVKVVARLIEDLGTRDWYFRIIGLDRLKEQETGQFGAILLVGAFKAGHLDKRVSSYLSKNPSNPKVVLFFTRGTEDPMPEQKKPDIRVDVVSSASRADRVETRAAELAALIKQRF